MRVVRKAVGGNGQDTQYAGGSVIRPYHFADTARSEAAPYRFAAETAALHNARRAQKACGKTGLTGFATSPGRPVVGPYRW